MKSCLARYDHFFSLGSVLSTQKVGESFETILAATAYDAPLGP